MKIVERKEKSFLRKELALKLNLKKEKKSKINTKLKRKYDSII